MASFALFGSVTLPDLVEGQQRVHPSLQNQLVGPIFVAPPAPPPPVPQVGPQIVISSGFTCTVSTGGRSW